MPVLGVPVTIFSAPLAEKRVGGDGPAGVALPRQISVVQVSSLVNPTGHLVRGVGDRSRASAFRVCCIELVFKFERKTDKLYINFKVTFSLAAHAVNKFYYLSGLLLRKHFFVYLVYYFNNKVTRITCSPFRLPFTTLHTVLDFSTFWQKN